MAELRVVKIKELKGARSDDLLRTSWLLVSEKTTGAKNISMGINETLPGGLVPEHKHDGEEEINFFLAGRGKFTTKDGEMDLEPGVCLYIPPGLGHTIINTGDETLRFIWIFSPQLANHRK